MAASISYKRDALTVIRPARVLDRGDELHDFENATEHISHGWRVQPPQRRRAPPDRHHRGPRRHRPPSLGHRPGRRQRHEHDRIRWRGRTWDIDGPVLRWRSPTGLLAHTEITLQLVEG